MQQKVMRWDFNRFTYKVGKIFLYLFIILIFTVITIGKLSHE